MMNGNGNNEHDKTLSFPSLSSIGWERGEDEIQKHNTLRDACIHRGMHAYNIKLLAFPSGNSCWIKHVHLALRQAFLLRIPIVSICLLL